MSFLGLIGAPVRTIPYPVYQGLKQAGGVLSGLLTAAEASAVASLVGSTALAVGAGLLGFGIGEAILKSLERPEVIPNPGDYFEAGLDGNTAKVTFSYYVMGVPVFSSIDSVSMPTPIVGAFYKYDTVNGARFFVRDGNGLERALVGSTFPQPGARLVIEGFKTTPGDAPLTPTKRVPSTLPNNPNPQPLAPVPIPVPGQPDFPVTPEVVPNPDNNPDEDEKEVQPGVIVKIPEVGLQVRYSPDGVSIGRYKSPDTAPFEVPQPELPDTNKRVAKPPCPCPETDNTEIICRLKALQDGLLDDGYDYATQNIALVGNGTYSGFPNELYAVRLNVTRPATGAKTQYGGGAAPNINYAGWLAFSTSGAYHERTQIQYDSQVFLAPGQANGFSFTATLGNKAAIQVTTRKKRDYADNC